MKLAVSMRIACGALCLATLVPVHAAPTIGGCPVLPANNYWNTPVDTLPVHASSAAWVTTIGNTARLHPDWGNVLSDNFGIPFVTVGATQPLVPIHPLVGEDFSDESDPGPYPVPSNAPIEGGPLSIGDRHVIVVDTGNCRLYELYRAFPNADGSWNASSYAKYDLNSNALRPSGWTSADAAGLPIFPGLLRWEEVAAGEIAHAIRFTAAQIWGHDAATNQRKFLWPARHWSGTSTVSTRPPMGARFRLKSSFDISGFSQHTQVILRAFKKYGLVLADAGSNWFFQGVSSESWPDTVFDELKSIAGSNFEAVDTSLLMVDPNSGEARLPATTNPARLFNLSTRGRVGSGADVMIGGFIIEGSVPKTVAVTATGPSLAAFGITGPLADPTLTLVRQADGVVVASNDNWGTAGNAAQLQAAGFAPTHPLESGLLVTLDPGAYTGIVSGVGGVTGVGLVAVYEVDRPDAPLINISTRGAVRTGEDVMIGGLVIQGDAPQTVVITGAGPSLSAFGIAGALANPTLTLVRVSDQVVLASNDNWADGADAAQIQAAGFAPAHALESAIMITLPPGAYTAILSGVGGTSGVGLVAVYAQ